MAAGPLEDGDSESGSLLESSHLKEDELHGETFKGEAIEHGAGRDHEVEKKSEGKYPYGMGYGMGMGMGPGMGYGMGMGGNPYMSGGAYGMNGMMGMPGMGMGAMGHMDHMGMHAMNNLMSG